MSAPQDGRHLPSFDEHRAMVTAGVGDIIETLVAELDAALGRGYAEKHPTLIAAALEANAVLTLASVVKTNGEWLSESCGWIAEELGSAVNQLQACAGELLDQPEVLPPPPQPRR